MGQFGKLLDIEHTQRWVGYGFGKTALVLGRKAFAISSVVHPGQRK